jgi:hypothetical protein
MFSSFIQGITGNQANNVLDRRSTLKALGDFTRYLKVTKNCYNTARLYGGYSLPKNPALLI